MISWLPQLYEIVTVVSSLTLALEEYSPELIQNLKRNHCRFGMLVVFLLYRVLTVKLSLRRVLEDERVLRGYQSRSNFDRRRRWSRGAVHRHADKVESRERSR